MTELHIFILNHEIIYLIDISRFQESNERNKEIDLNVIERSEVLTHPTASRAKAPKRRPPSGINFKDVSKI